MVADCKRARINEDTLYLARGTDSIRNVLQKVAHFTETGLIACIDISAMFYCFRIAPSMRAHFCFEHPYQDDHCYKRLPMGWISSPALAREKLSRIIYQHREYCLVYVDDIIIGGETPEEFLENYAAVLHTLCVANLRLKGRKCDILGQDMKILGRRVIKGVIQASPHILTKIAELTPDKIKTVKCMKRVLGLITFIGESLPFR